MPCLSNTAFPTHFVEELSEVETLVKSVDIIPVEVVVRNLAAGSMAKRLGLAEGTPLPRPIVEFYYKDDALGDPMVTEDHITVLGWASQGDLAVVANRASSQRGAARLLPQRGVILVDFKLEFGRLPDGKIVLADEISRTPVGSGTQRPTTSWTRTASAATSAEWRKRIRKSCDA